MKTQELDPVLSWMRTTDLVELAWKEGSAGFDLKLEGGPVIPDLPFPAPALTSVTSPAVGVFHWGAPGKPRRAVAGAPVAEGDVLGIVDTGARSVEVPAPTGGRLLKIIVEDGGAVEYGQLLFLLTP